MPQGEVSTIELFFRTWGGWIGLAAYVIIMQGVPFFRTQWWPSVVKNKEAEYQQRIIEVREDIEFRRGIERDRAAAAKVTSDAIQQLALAMVQQGERMTVILDNQRKIQEQQLDTQTFLSESLAAMREARAHQAGYTEGKHAPKTGPLKDDKSTT